MVFAQVGLLSSTNSRPISRLSLTHIAPREDNLFPVAEFDERNGYLWQPRTVVTGYCNESDTMRLDPSHACHFRDPALSAAGFAVLAF